MTAAQKQENLPVAKKQTEIVDSVLRRVQEFQVKGELDLPPNYSAANALKSAWLVLQETVDKNKKPVLSVCTRASIANALLSMVVQGLNVNKKQGYFIAYGKRLCFQRSYFGAVAVCKRVESSLQDVYAECIYKGDEVEYNILNGRRVIEKHTQKFESINDDNIVGAYAVAIGKDDRQMRCEIMTMKEIKQAWQQSQMKPVNEKGEIKSDSTHAKFTAEMAKKTVTNRIAKKIINTSADSDLLIQVVRQNDIDNEQAAAEEEIEENANQEVIDIEPADNSETTESENEPMTDEEKAEVEAEEKAAAMEEQEHTCAEKPPF